MKYANLLPPSGFRSMPWKNGSGTTKEIAREPETGENFLWRVSSALVEKSGHFSSYPAHHRLLTPLLGNLRLLAEGAEVELAPGDIHSFRGGDPVRAELSAPVQDLGLIYDPTRVRAEMSMLPFLGKTRSFRLTARTVFFYSLGKFSASCYPDELSFSLQKGDVLRVDKIPFERIVLLEPAEARSEMIALEIDW